MKHGKLASSIIVGVVVIVVSVMWVYTNYQRQNASIGTGGADTALPNPPPLPTGAGNINDPKTWSHYTYNHAFTVAYPPYWNVTVDQDDSTVTFTSLLFHQDNDFSIPYGGGTLVTYGIFGEHDISDMSLKKDEQFQDEDTSETMVVTNLTNLKIDGYPAVAFDYYPTDNVHFMQSRISILKDNKMYRFSAVYAEQSGKQLFEKMIQTLHFN